MLISMVDKVCNKTIVFFLSSEKENEDVTILWWRSHGEFSSNISSFVYMISQELHVMYMNVTFWKILTCYLYQTVIFQYLVVIVYWCYFDTLIMMFSNSLHHRREVFFE